MVYLGEQIGYSKVVDMGEIKASQSKVTLKGISPELQKDIESKRNHSIQNSPRSSQICESTSVHCEKKNQEEMNYGLGSSSFFEDYIPEEFYDDKNSHEKAGSSQESQSKPESIQAVD